METILYFNVLFLILFAAAIGFIFGYSYKATRRRDVISPAISKRPNTTSSPGNFNNVRKPGESLAEHFNRIVEQTPPEDVIFKVEQPAEKLSDMLDSSYARRINFDFDYTR